MFGGLAAKADIDLLMMSTSVCTTKYVASKALVEGTVQLNGVARRCDVHRASLRVSAAVFKHLALLVEFAEHPISAMRTKTG